MNEAADPQPDKACLQPPEPVVRVMIADDNLDHVATTAMLLTTEGYDVRGLPSGTALLAQFEAFRPRVVIADIGMPGITGYDVARSLRASNRGAEVLLIALSGYNTQTDKYLAALAGFDYHVGKPADPNMLTALIRDYLAGNRPVRIHVFPDHDHLR
jgi:CheY-like chemotaxis protein